MWCLGAGDDMPNGFPSFSQQVARRGNDTPLVMDSFHQGDTYGRNSKTPWLRKYIILRLDGRVDSRIAEDSGASWQK
jgi:hypothetical protein